MIKIEQTKEEQEANLKEACEVAERINGKPCNKCYGLGRDGWHIELEQYIPCQCIIEAATKARKAKIQEGSLTPELESIN